ncbi:MAG: MarR family transcriptional regulator [Alphaproteobacteria bacterium]|nr:MarR family transcriptional regulator [Alphaproteobacteria bacterium]
MVSDRGARAKAVAGTPRSPARPQATIGFSTRERGLDTFAPGADEDRLMARRKSRATPGGEAAFQVFVEILTTFFRLRAAGAKLGAVSPSGGGVWGFLRTLKLEGPRTVPQIARARPVARQYIQTLANEYAAQGLVEFIDNPDHKRSKLVRLTPEGEAFYEAITGRILGYCAEIARGMDEKELRTAARVLATLRAKLPGD